MPYCARPPPRHFTLPGMLSSLRGSSGFPLRLG
jgi:hypothetical protein